MTLSELIAEAKSETGRSEISDARYTTWINQVLDRIARAHDWQDLETRWAQDTEADEPEYLLPQDPECMVVKGIVLIDGSTSHQLVQAHPARMDELYPNPGALSTQRPRAYVLWRRTYELVPIPDAVYCLYIRYLHLATVLSSALDEPDIKGIDDVLLAEVCARVFRNVGLMEKWQAFHSHFVELLAEQIRHDRRRPDWHPAFSDIRGKQSVGEAANPFVGL